MNADGKGQLTADRGSPGEPPSQFERLARLVGRILGDKFRLTGCIGIGGSGAVFRADQIALGRTVAVKLLNEEFSSDKKMIRRFEDEAVSASRLNHPNCVSIIDYGQSPDGLLYLAMEYVKGPTLTQLLVNENPLAIDRVIDIIMQVLAGIDEAHVSGVVHADLKADNIIVDQRRSGIDVVKIVDFGIARMVTRNRDPDDTTVSGTPEYMAPELIRGAQPSFASDIYAVGVILYELLACRTPFFGGSTMEILSNHLIAEVPPLVSRRPQLPKQIEAVVARALAKHPDKRFSSAGEMRRALGIRRSKRAAYTQSDRCPACGVPMSMSFKFCPGCGSPRDRTSIEIEVPRMPTHSVLPLRFIGRELELSALLEHFTRPASDACGMLLTGIEGSGRTALLQQTFKKLRPTTRCCVVGPDPSGLETPYYPIRSLLAAVLQISRDLPEQALVAALRSIGTPEHDVAGIERLFGRDVRQLGIEPEVQRRDLCTSVLRVLERAAKVHPIALVCEDIEAFDHPSLEVLHGATEAFELLLPPLVMTAATQFAEAWAPSIRRIELGALDAGDFAGLIEELEESGLKGIPPVQRLYQITQAIPGHIVHVIRYLLDGGRPEDTTTSLPDLVSARVSLQDQWTRDVLQAASVLGFMPQHDLLRAMFPSESLETAVATAVSAGLLDRSESGGLRFASRLVRDIIYDSTPADVRRSLHAAVAIACESQPFNSALMGHHHELAGNAEEAMVRLGEAAKHRADQLDDVGAVRFYQRALAACRHVARDGHEWVETQFVILSVKLATVMGARGEISLARSVLSEARDRVDGASVSTPALVAMLDQATATLVWREAKAGHRRAVVQQD